MSEGFLLIVSGPAGTGKGTICKEILKKNEEIIFSVSATTRQPRVGEIDGVNYYFMDENKFKKMKENNDFLEWACVHTNYYGTPKKPVFENIEDGKIVLLEIDVQGALQIKENYPEAVFIFILPPTMDELRNRIINRGTETKEDIERRLKNAFKELEFVDEYDYFIINNRIDDAIKDIESIIHAEKLKVKRHSNIKEKIISKGGI